MVFGKIAKEKFAYTSDMAYVYFLSDGFVYAAFNTTLPSGWTALTEVAFVEYTREMYADSLTWGVGKPLIQIANTSRYGLVLLANEVTDDSPLKVATASAVKLAYDIAVEAYHAVSASGEVGQLLFDSIRAAKDSKSYVAFGSDGTVTETVRNANNDHQLATKVTTFNANGSITCVVTYFEPDGVSVKAVYTTTTVFNPDGTITSTTI